MAANLFVNLCIMNALKAMSPNSLYNLEALIQPQIRIQADNEYITLVYNNIQVLYGRQYNSWEIVKNGFTNAEVQYLIDIGFHRPDQNAFQAWGDINP